jgi:succinate dehydrogenase/fumarate reductase flavoprotein subunit
MTEAILRGDAPHGLRVRFDPAILDVDFTFITGYVRWLREARGVDIARDEIRLAPFFHAANGGVKIGADCQTDVRGLFACGEVSGGIHGADRQGGNSTGSCLVFGRIAAERAAQCAAGAVSRPISPALAEESLRAHYGNGGSGRLTPEALLPEIRRLLWRSAGVVREEKALRGALEALQNWAEDYRALPEITRPKTSRDAAKAAHFLLLGQALLTAMLARRESREVTIARITRFCRRHGPGGWSFFLRAARCAAGLKNGGCE